MKKLICFLLILCMCLSFSACGQTNSSNITPQETTNKDDYYPITVTDQAGREVIIEKEPERLVSCYYITSSLLIALDLDDKIVGIEDNPDYRPIYGLSAPDLLKLPWVGTAKPLNIEACASVEPDLIILPLRLIDSAETLESLGMNVLFVNPESQDLLNEMIRLIGAATNTQELAEELLSFISAQETFLAEKLKDTPSPTIYLSGNSNFLSTAGNSMYQSDMIRLAGGTNVAAGIEDTYWTVIDYEQLLTWDPEYIIMASSAKYTVDDVLNDPNLASCQAVINKNVYQIPDYAESWDSPVPGSILGALWLANLLHPAQLSDADCISIMDTYYETFYNFTYSKN